MGHRVVPHEVPRRRAKALYDVESADDKQSAGRASVHQQFYELAASTRPGCSQYPAAERAWGKDIPDQDTDPDESAVSCVSDL